MSQLAEIQSRLQRHGQSHLLRWWDELTAPERHELLTQIESLDLELVHRLFHNRHKGEVSPAELASRATPPSQLVAQPVSAADHEVWQRARARGEDHLRQGRVAAVLVAGGQGSRLGFEKPKGMYPVGPVTDRTLFQIFCEQLLARARRSGAAIPYFVMTSDATHDETVAFFQEQQFFGLNKSDVYFFRQGKLPAVDDQTGRILMAEKSEVALSPDGHGGLLKALRAAGLMEVMRERGIETLFYHQVDNPTSIVVDPAFIGLHLEHGSDISTKVVNKVSAEEKMGVLVSVDGQTQIIEYSDMPVTRTQELEPDGTLRFRAGNTAMHVIRRGFLQELIDQGRDLPYHRAHKPVAFIDESAQRIVPASTSKNAFKFEQFIFDTLPMAKVALVVEADRAREFNPVKNASGADSPETCRAALCRIARDWVRAAGAEVADDARIEVSPLVSLEGEGFSSRITAGQVITDGTVLKA